MTTDCDDTALWQYLDARFVWLCWLVAYKNGKGWRVALCDGLPPDTLVRTDDKTKQIQCDRTKALNYWLEQRTWLVEAQIVLSLIHIMDQQCNRCGFFDYLRVAQAAEQAEAVGEDELAKKLSLLSRAPEQNNARRGHFVCPRHARPILDRMTLDAILERMVERLNLLGARLQPWGQPIPSGASATAVHKLLRATRMLCVKLRVVASLGGKPRDEVVKAALEDANKVFLEMRQAEHTARVEVVQARANMHIDKIDEQISSDALRMVDYLDECIFAAYDDAVDHAVAKEAARVLQIPPEWLRWGRYRQFWRYPNWK